MVIGVLSTVLWNPGGVQLPCKDCEEAIKDHTWKKSTALTIPPGDPALPATEFGVPVVPAGPDKLGSLIGNVACGKDAVKEVDVPFCDDELVPPLHLLLVHWSASSADACIPDASEVA